MRRIASIISFVIFILFTLLLFFQLPPIQHAIKEYLEYAFSQNNPYQLRIERMKGFLPFSMTCERISITQEDELLCTINEARIVPSWLEMLKGELVFIETSIKGVHLFSLPHNMQSEKKENSSTLPNISLYSVRASDVFLPSILKEKLKIDDEEKAFMSFSGSLFTNFSKKEGVFRGTFSLYSERSKILDLGCDLKLKEHNLSCKSQSTAYKTSWTPYFQDLHLQEGSFQAALRINYEHLFDDILHGHVNPLNDYTLTGTWKSHLTFDNNVSEKLNNIHSVLLEGTLFSRKCEVQIEAKNIQGIPCTTNDLTVFPLTQIGSFSSTCNFIKDDLENKVSILFRSPYLNILDNQIHDIFCSSIFSLRKDETECNLEGNFKAPFIEKESCQILVQSLFDQDSITIKKAHLLSEDAIINTSGRYDRLKNTYDGFCNAHLPRLCDIDYRLQGEAVLSLLFSLDEEKQKITSDLSLKNVIAPHFECANGQAHIDIDDLATLFNTRLEGSFEDIKSNETEIHAIHIHSKMPTKSQNWTFPLTLLVEIPFKDNIAKMHLESIVQFQPEKSDFFIRTKTDLFEIEHPIGLIKNKEPIICTYGPNAFQIKPFSLLFDDLTILKGDASFTDSQISGHLFCQKIPLELCNLFSKNRWIDGNAGLDLQWYGKPSDPKLICQFSVQDLCLFSKGHPLFAPCSGYSTTRLENNTCFSKGQLVGAIFKQPLSWDLSFPCGCSTGSISLPNSGSLEGEIDLGLYFERHIEENEEIQGIMQLGFNFHDKKNHPHILGEIDIKDGYLNMLKTGGIFSSLEMKIQVKDSLLTAHSIKASDGQDGSYSGTGHLEFSFEKHFPFEVHLEANNCLLIDVEYATAFADGAATLIGDFQSAVLTGLFIGKNAEFFLNAPFSVNAPKIPITFINTSEEKPQKSASKFELNLDLDIDLPNKGFITGLGVESEWQGHAKIYGAPDLIRVFGQIDLMKGTLSFLDKKFLLSKGIVEFDGDLLKESRLNILADIKSSQLTGGVYVRGNLESPRFTFHSTPAMSEKEILCHILFNKSSSEISPVEGVQLAQVIFKLYGKDQSIDFFDTIKKTLRLDRIASAVSNGPQKISRTNAELLATEAANPQQSIANAISFQIGKYISEGIMLTLSKDVSKEANRIGIEASVTDKLTAEAAIGDDSEGQVSLKWKHQY